MLNTRMFLYIAIVCVFCSIRSLALADASDKPIAPITVFDNFWQETKSNIYP